MTTIDINALLEKAAEEGFSNELLPPNEYDVEIAGTSTGSSQGGKPQIGVRFKVEGGPHNGKSFWDNMTLTQDNPKAVAVFFRQLGNLGVSTDALRAQSSVEGIAALITVGAKFKVTLGHRTYNNKTYHDVKKLVRRDGAGGAAVPVAPVPVPAAPVPVAAPVPAAVGTQPPSF